MDLPPGLAGPVQVALARATERIPQPDALPGGVRYEPKWDGFRAVIVCDGAGAQLWSRRGTDLTPTFPEVVAAATDQIAPASVVDGELVVWSSGRLDFGALQSRMGRGTRSAAQHARQHPASYVAFDVLAHEGHDVRALPFDERRRLLETLASSWRPPLNLSPVTTDARLAEVWFDELAVAGVEGLVIKGAAQPYPSGQRLWLKVKHRATLDVVCGAVTGTRTAPQDVVAGLTIDGHLRIVGRSTPLSSTARRDLARWLVPPADKHPWPTQVPRTALARYNASRRDMVELTLVEPIVVEVSADVAWDGRSFRHPLRFLRVRPELHPTETSPPSRTA